MMATRSVSSLVCSGCWNEVLICISNTNEVSYFGIQSTMDYENFWQPWGGKRESVQFSINYISSPTVISFLTNIVSVSVSNKHTLCLDMDGNVFSFSLDEKSQLDDNYNHIDSDYVNPDIYYQSSILQKIDIPPICQISSGNYFTICLSEDKELYSFGNNQYGQLGIGKRVDCSDENYYKPSQKIKSMKDIEFVECGRNFVFCKTLNNEIYCWGRNDFGQLGLGNNEDQNTPILCSSLSNEDVIDIKCGDSHTLVLTSSGVVLSCGNNSDGQLGRETNNNSSFQKIEDLSEITRIECGYYHSLCIDINYNLYVFGRNCQNTLGLGKTEKIERPTKHYLSNIIDISSGGYNVFVKTISNEIFILKTANELDFTPIRVFENNEDIWYTDRKSKAKSARK